MPSLRNTLAALSLVVAALAAHGQAEAAVTFNGISLNGMRIQGVMLRGVMLQSIAPRMIEDDKEEPRLEGERDDPSEAFDPGAVTIERIILLEAEVKPMPPVRSDGQEARRELRLKPPAAAGG